VRIDVRRTEQLKQGNEIYGNHVRCKIVKNKVAPPFKVAEFDIIYGQGISRASEILDFAIELEIIKKSGSWFSYNGERLGQGKDTVRKMVESDPAFMADLEEKVRAASAETDLLAAKEFELDEEEDEDGLDEDFDIQSLDDGDEE
jgi:recombination protein RecA